MTMRETIFLKRKNLSVTFSHNTIHNSDYMLPSIEYETEIESVKRSGVDVTDLIDSSLEVEINEEINKWLEQ